jgi:dienelactone hydrolase
MIMAIFSSFDLFSNKEKLNVHKPQQFILRSVGLIVLYFIFSIPAILFPQMKEIEVTGALQVQTATFTFEDHNRIETYSNSGENRKLTVQFWFPDNSEKKYPLVVFSHGSLGVRTSNLTLYRELASHGYVVASIDHTYQSFFTTHDNGKTIFLNMNYSRELQGEDARKNRQQSFELYQKWMNIRMGDIDFVMDTIISEAKKNKTDLVYQLIDTEKIGVMGHSLGGSAALGIGRTRDDVLAVISLEAPFMYDIIDVEDGEFLFTKEKYPVPVLNVYSDSLWEIMSDRPQYAMNYSLLTDSEETTHNKHISGIGHLSLTDFALTSPILTRMIDGQKSTEDITETIKLINQISLSFFDSYLKEEGLFSTDLP